MRRLCASCSAEFEAKRNTARYCSARCRMRASRQGRQAEPAAAPAAAPGRMPLAEATLADLERAGRQLSPSGVAALALAERIDAGSAETGASLASLVREHRAALADALAGSAAAATPLDELRARRDRKAAR